MNGRGKDKRMAKKNKKQRYQMSKVLTGVILLVAIADLQLSYILAFMGKEIAETLSIAIVTEIVAVVLGYFIKAFNETKEAEKIKLEIKKNKLKREEIPESEDKE